MIIPEEELVNYLGNDLGTIEGIVYSKTLEKLRRYNEYTTNEFYLPVLDYLFLAYQQGNRSLMALSKEVRIDINTLKQIFDRLSLPRLTLDEVLQREVKLRVGFHGCSEEEKRNYRSKGGKRTAQLRVGVYALSEEQRRNFGRMGGKKSAKLKVGVHGFDADTGECYTSKGGKNSMALLQSRLQTDPEFRKKNAEAVRRARLNPENIGKYSVRAIYGDRNDIGPAQSTWEANFARILTYCGRDFYTREKFRLRVPEEYRHLFNSEETEANIDFVVREPRGNRVLYEIMAHPLEGKRDYAKLEMLRQQYPQIKLRIIDAKFYDRLRSYFEGRINSDMRFLGWETEKDNLRTNPKKYLLKVNSEPTLK